MTYLALAWLGLLVLAANSGVGVPDGFGLAVFGLTLASLIYLYARLCRRWPVFAWAGLGFLAGVFGWQRPVYVYNEVTVDDEGNEVAVYDDCGAANDCSYDSSDDGGGSSGSRED